MFMARRHPQEVILARWTIDDALWCVFLKIKENRERDDEPHPPYSTFIPPKEFPPSGLDVVIRDDAVFVGNKCVREFVYEGGYHNMTVREGILGMYGTSDMGGYIYLLPIAHHAIADVTHVAERFAAEDAEAARIQAEEAARPTVSNRLLWWVQKHFILAMLLIFFVIIPLLALCAHYLNLALGGE
jgi:hypothetical protein